MDEAVRRYIDGIDPAFRPLFERHPELRSGQGTIRLRPEEAAALADDELPTLIRAVLG